MKIKWCTMSYNNTYKNRAKKVGEKNRIYINVYEYDNNEFKFIKRCKITDCLIYNSTSAVYRSLRTHKIVYSRKYNKYYRYSYDNIQELRR